MTSMMASVIQAGETTNFNLSERAMKRNLAYILGVLFVMTSCVEEKVLDNIVPTPGDEVVFTAGLNTGVQTKTLYGADNGTKPIKVKWVNGDKVMVYGTTCTEGSDCQVAEYQVSTSKTSTPNTDDGQNVADGLDKTGDIGVRWGSASTSDFVAVYPSENASFTYNETSKVVTATTSIDSTQNYVFNDEPTSKTVTNSDGTTSTISVWEGTHFANDATDPSMSNAIMYARTDDVKAGDPVGLSFKPFSTVLKFRFMGFDSNLFPNTELYIQNIKITAPKGYHIAGDFDMTIPRNEDVENNPVTATSKNNSTNTNTVTINTIKSGGSYLKLAANQAVEFNVFTVPLSGLKMTSTDLWTVTIQAQGYEPWVYKMIPTATGGYTLVPGLIHKVKVPQLISKTEVEWNPENWITQIPVPVYISELSVPGAWYCFDSGYQNTTDLATLYKAGIRAFNIDCRIAKKGETNDGSAWTVTGSYTYEEEWNDSADYPKNAYLACAGTETNDNGQGGGVIPKGNYNIIDGIYVESAVKDLITLAQSHPKEYIVIVFSFAEKPKTINYIGTNKVYGSVNPIWIMNELNTILNTSGIKEYLYTNITKDTTIDDITKKQSDGYVKNVIVKINHCIDNFYTSLASVDNDNSTSTPNKSVIPAGLMGSFGSMSSNSTYNLKDDIITNIAGLHSETTYTDYFTTMRTDAIYIGTNESDLQYCYHQAQNTSSSPTRGEEGTGIPTLGMRMDAIDDIIGQSKDVYDNAKHDHWFQMGIGGSIDGDNPSGVSNVLNPYLYGRIMKKMDKDPSPVGIVLMNHATSTTANTITTTDPETNEEVTYKASSQDLVQAIIEMNGKFYLNRVGGSITTGDGTGSGSGSGSGTTTTSTKNAAYAVVGDNAF